MPKGDIMAIYKQIMSVALAGIMVSNVAMASANITAENDVNNIDVISLASNGLLTEQTQGVRLLSAEEETEVKGGITLISLGTLIAAILTLKPWKR